jgi:hypothetical protein
MNKSGRRPSYKQLPMMADNYARMRNRACVTGAKNSTQRSTEGIGKLIEEMEAQKAALHPKQE